MSSSNAPGGREVESVLRRDPSGAYGQMDDATRSDYLAAVSEWSRRIGVPPVTLAERALAKSLAAADAPFAAPAAAHVGYYLLGPGSLALAADMRAGGGWSERLRRSLERSPDAYRAGIVAGLVGAVVCAALVYATHQGAAPPTLLPLACLLVPVVLNPCSNAARHVLRQFFPPRILPRLAFHDGIPDSCRTLVVVPTVLSTPQQVRTQLQRLELMALEQDEKNLRFALLSDFPDDSHQHGPYDHEVLGVAADMVRTLNDGYRDELGDKFFVLHRERRWSPTEGAWIGWERKRGKIEELNELLLDRTALTSYKWVFGDFARLLTECRFRYVVTLDDDSRLARGAARELVRTAAHPLNCPFYDEVAGRVVAGYGILQPQLVPIPAQLDEGAGTSLYQRIVGGLFRRRGGTIARPQAGRVQSTQRAHRDIYFDISGVTRYVGKGLYDVGAFRAALAGVVPEGLVLMHDHLEGCYLRVGSVLSATILEESNARYITGRAQDHRWFRGELQLLPWVLSRVRDGRGEWRANPMSVAARCGILRQAARPTDVMAAVLLLLLAWTVLPGSVVVWMLLAFCGDVCRLVPLVARSSARSLLAAIDRTGDADNRVRSSAGWLHVANYAVSLGFRVITAADTALHRADAMCRALWRLLVSRERLLQWTAQRHLEGHTQCNLRHYLRAMLPAAAAGLLTFCVVLAVNPGRLRAAAPFISMWLVAWLVAWYADRPRRPGREGPDPPSRPEGVHVAAT